MAITIDISSSSKLTAVDIVIASILISAVDRCFISRQLNTMPALRVDSFLDLHIFDTNITTSAVLLISAVDNYFIYTDTSSR